MRPNLAGRVLIPKLSWFKIYVDRPIPKLLCKLKTRITNCCESTPCLWANTVTYIWGILDVDLHKWNLKCSSLISFPWDNVTLQSGNGWKTQLPVNDAVAITVLTWKSHLGTWRRDQLRPSPVRFDTEGAHLRKYACIILLFSLKVTYFSLVCSTKTEESSLSDLLPPTHWKLGWKGQQGHFWS